MRPLLLSSPRVAELRTSSSSAHQSSAASISKVNTIICTTTMWTHNILSLILLHTAQSSLMSRIGLRLGAAHAHNRGALDHKPRQPWAVKNMKEEMLASERKPWQPLKTSQIIFSIMIFYRIFIGQQIGAIDEDERPQACVGICYYNKLMALEAKEDLTNHNLVYKDKVFIQHLNILDYFYINLDCHI